VTAATETEDRLATQIAVMALVYRELSRCWHLDQYGQQVWYPDVSLLLMMSRSFMCETDWEVIWALNSSRSGKLIALYRALLEIDERRAEALLHVWPTSELHLPLVPPVAYDRWNAVARQMLIFDDAGVTSSPDDIAAIAERVNAAGAETVLIEH
jgi:hypothetical protein